MGYAEVTDWACILDLASLGNSWFREAGSGLISLKAHTTVHNGCRLHTVVMGTILCTHQMGFQDLNLGMCCLQDICKMRAERRCISLGFALADADVRTSKACPG
jgi:hypothetical protein